MRSNINVSGADFKIVTDDAVVCQSLCSVTVDLSASRSVRLFVRVSCSDNKEFYESNDIKNMLSIVLTGYVKTYLINRCMANYAWRSCNGVYC